MSEQEQSQERLVNLLSRVLMASYFLLVALSPYYLSQKGGHNVLAFTPVPHNYFWFLVLPLTAMAAIGGGLLIPRTTSRSAALALAVYLFIAWIIPSLKMPGIGLYRDQFANLAVVGSLLLLFGVDKGGPTWSKITAIGRILICLVFFQSVVMSIYYLKTISFLKLLTLSLNAGIGICFLVGYRTMWAFIVYSGMQLFLLGLSIFFRLQRGPVTYKFSSSVYSNELAQVAIIGGMLLVAYYGSAYCLRPESKIEDERSGRTVPQWLWWSACFIAPVASICSFAVGLM